MTDLEKAKEIINSYCNAEFGYEADYDVLTDVGLAYTTITDDELEIQVNANLVDFCIEKYLEGNFETPVEVIQFENLKEMNDWMEENLDFEWLIQVEGMEE